MAFRQRYQVLRRRAEGHRDALFLLEVEAADAQLRIELGDDARAAADHEVHLAFFVLQRILDLLGALDGIAGRLAEAGEVVDALEVLARPVRAP